MELRDVVAAMFERIWSVVDASLEGLTQDELERRPTAEANSMGWLAWHTARVEDRSIHQLTDPSQERWRQGWAERMGMPHLLDVSGGAMSLEDIAAFKTPALGRLTAYAQDVRADTSGYVATIPNDGLDREIESWFGRRVPLGEVLAHVTCELNQHAGQMAYVRGLYRGYQGAAGPFAVSA